MKLKPFLIELAILIASILLVHLLVIFFGRTQFDINLHDTYVVSSGSIISLPVFLLIFIVYIIKEAFYRYKRRLQNLILLTALFFINMEVSTFVGSVTQMSKTVSQFKGWTVYPPLSALPSHQPAVVPLQPDPFSRISEIFFYMQIFFLALLVILAIVTGKNWNTDKNGS
ncbi:hypothetical protein SAMN05216524_106204 [Mucilaginibacter sp. OK098]|nr:hypothetical protein SAMN05216524_106204 [Mucilaginibacter sp. OK098]